MWNLWVAFCEDHGDRPSLSNLVDSEARLTRLLVFGLRYRQRPGAGGKPVRAGTVDKALLAVGQGISDLDQPDPRLQANGSKRRLLADFLKTLKDEDDPQTRVHPANITMLRAFPDCLDFDHAEYGILTAHTADLIIVAFFWLLRPAEYTHQSDRVSSRRRSQAFRYKDVSFTINGRIYNAPDAPLNDANSLATITHATLEFADQKTGVRGERVGHRATTDPYICPCKALGRIVLRLRAANADPTKPLNAHYNSHPDHNRWYYVSNEFVTNTIRHAANYTADKTGIPGELVSARSLRPGGATALLCANVDADVIKLLGRWKSDAMFRYLRTQALAQSRHLSGDMLAHGAFTFAPGVDQARALPNEAPAGAAAALA